VVQAVIAITVIDERHEITLVNGEQFKVRVAEDVLAACYLSFWLSCPREMDATLASGDSRLRIRPIEKCTCSGVFRNIYSTTSFTISINDQRKPFSSIPPSQS
jgi:hypothetical protein